MAKQLPNSQPDGQAPDRMQRVRVGITGLASVILLLAVAGAISAGVDRRANESATTPPPVTATIEVPSNVADPQEPLAQLGVAPDTKRNDASKSAP
jgi:hypothetical protein